MMKTYGQKLEVFLSEINRLESESLKLRRDAPKKEKRHWSSIKTHLRKTRINIIEINSKLDSERAEQIIEL